MSQYVFALEEKKAYLGDHLYLGLSQLIKFLLPLILWFSWKRPVINNTTTNLWFLYTWKTLCYGYIIAYGLPSILWLFSFTNVSSLS